jgi:hypothetical protein
MRLGGCLCGWNFCHDAPLNPAAVPCLRVFAGAVEGGGIVKGMRVPEGKAISNSRVKPKGDISSEACPPLLRCVSKACMSWMGGLC